MSTGRAFFRSARPPQFDNCIVPLVSPEDTDLILLERIKVVTEIQRPYNT